MRWLTVVLVVSCCASLLFAGSAQDRLSGTWEGDSVCVDKVAFPACKDEHVVYHITAKRGSPNLFHMVANKVVDKKEESMGELDFTFAPKEHRLTSEFRVNKTHGLFTFTLTGATLTGRLDDLDRHRQVRRIRVKKRS